MKPSHVLFWLVLLLPYQCSARLTVRRRIVNNDSSSSHSESSSSDDELENPLLELAYSIPGVHRVLTWLCFSDEPGRFLQRPLRGVQVRDTAQDARQLVLWGILGTGIRALLAGSISFPAIILTGLLDLASLFARYTVTVLLQRWENQARTLYAHYGQRGLLGPFRDMRRPPHGSHETSRRHLLSHPITGALFNWSNKSRARLIAIAKILLLCLGLFVVRRLLLRDAFFIINGAADVLWLASFWGIVLLEYLKPHPALLPFLLGLQSLVFR